MLNTNHNLLFKATVLALCVISFVHVFLFPLYDMNAGRTFSKTYMDFEQSLCTSNIRSSYAYGSIFLQGYQQHQQQQQQPSQQNKKQFSSSSPHRRRYYYHGRTSSKWPPSSREKGGALLLPRQCPQYGIVTIMQGGRLGNQMWEYASVWALARRTGLEPYVPRCVRLKLDQVFESLTVPTFEEISHCPVDLSRFVKSLDEWNFTNQSIVLPRYSIQPELVITWVQDIVQEFTIKKKLLTKSQQILRAAAASSVSSKINNRTVVTMTTSTNINKIFVGVHVRRTDYLGYLMRKHNAHPATVTFFKMAMRHFEIKYSSPYVEVVFVMVSDDPQWCKKKFSKKRNVYITGKTQKNSPALDMAILASCNHSIFDYGTFGEWGAILAGGETIYYNLTHHSTERLGQLLTNWHTI